MRSSLRVWLGLVLITAFAAGCALAPIYNVEKQPVVTHTPNPTMDQVGKAIQVAGSSRGWVMQPDGPGHMTGTLNQRDHTAVVDVSYSTTQYSINYKSSNALKYDAKTGKIHSNYNKWIQYLDSAIKTELARI